MSAKKPSKDSDDDSSSDDSSEDEKASKKANGKAAKVGGHCISQYLLTHIPLFVIGRVFV